LSGHNIFAVIPALNEASTIAAVIHDVRTYIQQVVVVNDGSKDETSLEASKAGAHVIHHQYNLDRHILFQYHLFPLQRDWFSHSSQ